MSEVSVLKDLPLTLGILTPLEKYVNEVSSLTT